MRRRRGTSAVGRSRRNRRTHQPAAALKPPHPTAFSPRRTSTAAPQSFRNRPAQTDCEHGGFGQRHRFADRARRGRLRPRCRCSGVFAGTRPRLNLSIDGRSATYNEFAFGTQSPVGSCSRWKSCAGRKIHVRGQNAGGGRVVMRLKDPTDEWE